MIAKLTLFASGLAFGFQKSVVNHYMVGKAKHAAVIFAIARFAMHGGFVAVQYAEVLAGFDVGKGLLQHSPRALGLGFAYAAWGNGHHSRQTSRFYAVFAVFGMTNKIFHSYLLF